jgi:TonB family protein
VDFSSCVQPVYPQEDVKARHTGMVAVAFLLNRDGVVLDSRVLRSSGYTSLDEAARQAIAKCRFSAVPETGPAEQWQPVQYVWTFD